MVGDVGCLSGGEQPVIIDRPYRWETGKTIPEQYLQQMNKLLRRGYRGMMVFAAVLALIALAIDVGIVLSGEIGEDIIGTVLTNVVFLGTAAVVYVIERDKYKNSTEALQAGNFRWRTGTLDDLVSQITGYVRRRHRRGPTFEEYAFVDGEEVKVASLADTTFKRSYRGYFEHKKTQITVRCSGKIGLGASVVLVDLDGGAYILPYN